MEHSDSSREKTQKRSATKIQSIFRGYDTRKLTTAIKQNYTRFKKGPTRQERRSEVPVIFKQLFDKHNKVIGISRDSRDEVNLIMSRLKQTQEEDFVEYKNKIQSLVTKMKDTLNGFHGKTEEARAKVYKELEELRYLFYIPYYKAWGWHFQDQEYKTTMSVQNPLPPDWYKDSEGRDGSLSESARADSKFLYDWFLSDPAVLMERYIKKELPILSSYDEHLGIAPPYMKRRGGRRKNRHTIKLRKKYIKIY